LGEGKVIGGCVTCPWHGYQYLPGSGASPPPFQEKVATYRVKVIEGKVFVNPQACAPGKPVAPACVSGPARQPEPDEFYIGYEPNVPPHIRASVKRAVIGIGLLAAGVALVLVFGQNRFEPSQFEFLQFREFEGVIEEFPAPTLLVERPGASGPQSQASRYLLVVAGKHGAGAQVAGFLGKRVQLTGSLIYRQGLTMVELVPGSLRLMETAAPTLESTPAIHLGMHTLNGEIVDSKCYFGVMNPGHSKVHRDCAVRCISGGIPPAFLVRDGQGNSLVLLLVGEDGRPVHREVLAHVGEPLEISGQIFRRGDTLILKADPERFRPAHFLSAAAASR
jgi:hypothetical protein